MEAESAQRGEVRGSQVAVAGRSLPRRSACAERAARRRANIAAMPVCALAAASRPGCRGARCCRGWRGRTRHGGGDGGARVSLRAPPHRGDRADARRRRLAALARRLSHRVPHRPASQRDGLARDDRRCGRPRHGPPPRPHRRRRRLRDQPRSPVRPAGGRGARDGCPRRSASSRCSATTTTSGTCRRR